MNMYAIGRAMKWCLPVLAVGLSVLSGAHRKEQLEREPHTLLIASVAALSSVQL